MEKLKGKIIYQGKEIEIEFSDETAKGIIEQLEKPKLTGWETNDGGFILFSNGGTDAFPILFNDNKYVNNNKYVDELVDNLVIFSTREKAEEIHREQLLYRKLKKFSDEHNGDKID